MFEDQHKHHLTDSTPNILKYHCLQMCHEHHYVMDNQLHRFYHNRLHNYLVDIFQRIY